MLDETGELTRENMARGFKLAISGETVYVGKRDGQLFQSLDGGDNWNDITENLPLPIEHFNQIAFTDSTVHVATDKGVFNSIDGVVWHTITDKAGETLIIKSLATPQFNTLSTSIFYMRLPYCSSTNSLCVYTFYAKLDVV